MKLALITIGAALLVGGGVVVGALLTDDPVAPAEAGPGAAEEAGGGERAVTPLNFFEEKLVGGWSRYHSYDGSYQRAIFSADRTGCKWDKTASGDVKSKRSMTWWEVAEEKDSGGTYYVAFGKPGDLSGGWAFDYADDELLMGASNLILVRDPELRECFS